MISAILLLLQVGWAEPLPADSVEAILDDVRDVQARYARLARTLAPVIFGRGSGGDCDERVGRFCLHHDPTSSPPKERESPRLAAARRDVVETLRQAFARLPGEFRVAGPLVRYLVEDERAEEALSAARTFAALSEDSVHADLLLGFAYHAAARDSLAERHFDRALARMAAEERRELERVDVLLSGAEHGHYEDLTGEERTEYERALWTLADPLYLTPGNERRAEHLARHVWVRLFSDAPATVSSRSWGDDLAELTLRYGVPESRAMVIEPFSALNKRHLVEWYDSAQLAYLPQALRTEGPPPAPPPGADWPLDDPFARSQYAPETIRRMVRLDHRVARFPAGDSVRLRLTGVMALDAATGDSVRAVEAALFVLDDTYTRVREVRRRVPVVRDSAEVSFEVELPPGSYVYSVELLEPESRLAGRARYAVELPRYPRATVALSDVLDLTAFGTGERPVRAAPDTLPRPAWRPLPADTLGLYAEVHGLLPAPDGTTRYRAEVALHPVEDGSIPARAVRWVGRKLGLIGPPEEMRVAWEAQGEGGRPAVLAVDFTLNDLEPGLYTLEISVEDQVSGMRQTSERIIRIRAPTAP